MLNNQDEKWRVTVRYLKAQDQHDLEKFIDQSTNAQRAGLQMTANPQVRQWAISQWIEKQTLVGIFYERQLIGLITVFPTSEGGEVGYFIADSWTGHHVMTRALAQFLENSPYENLTANVAANNKASQHVLENNGFIQQGCNDGMLRYRWQIA